MLNRLGPVSTGQPFKQISIQKGFVQLETMQLMTVCEEYFSSSSVHRKSSPSNGGLQHVRSQPREECCLNSDRTLLFPRGNGVLTEMQTFVGAFYFPQEMTVPEERKVLLTFGVGF